MHRNQIFILIGIVLLLGAVAIGAWVLLTALNGDTQAPGETQTIPASDPFGSITVPGSVGGGSTMTLVSTEGNPITVPDFTKGKQPIEFAGQSYYFLYGPEYSTEGFAFSVQYHTTDSSFLVELLAEPLGESREKAGEYLSELLTLSAENLCQINARVVVGDGVNQQFSGSPNLGLAGCAGSVELP